jgi:hypothetical protein
MGLTGAAARVVSRIRLPYNLHPEADRRRVAGHQEMFHAME